MNKKKLIITALLLALSTHTIFAASMSAINSYNIQAITYDVDNAISEVVNSINVEITESNGVTRLLQNEKSSAVYKELINEIRSRIHPNVVNLAVLTKIPKSEYIFELDETQTPIGIRLKTSSALGKCLLSSSRYDSLYTYINNENEYIKLRNGLFNVEYLNGEFFYALDINGNIIRGLVATNGQELLTLNNSNSFDVKKSYDSHIFFCFNEPGLYSGVFWCSEVPFGKFIFTFDNHARLSYAKKIAIEDKTIPILSGTWEYNLDINHWRFSQIDNNNNKIYLRNGFYKIKSINGRINNYLFDSDGNMMVGLVKYNGNTYYLQENEKYIGAMYVGKITIKGIPYTFDEQGIMVDTMNKNMQITNKKYYSN